MKRLPMIVAIPLLVVLIASFGAESQTYEPEVNSFGNLTGFKNEQGRHLFGNNRGGFYVSYHVANGMERTIYAIENQISIPNASYSGVLEASSAAGFTTMAGFTTQDGLNVTSRYDLDKSGGRLLMSRRINNYSKATVRLSEFRDYIDLDLRALSVAAGSPIDVALPSGPGVKRNLVPVQTGNPNCQPCFPECPLARPALDLSSATVVCANSENVLKGEVHAVSLPNLKKYLDQYRELGERGCNHPVAYVGIYVRAGRSLYLDNSPKTRAKVKSPSRGGGEISQELSETDVQRWSILPAGASRALKIVYGMK